LPAKIKRQYAEIWREYLQNKTELSRFVHRIDKLEMALQADRYKSQGHSKLDQFFESAHKTVDSQDDILKDILKALNRSASKRN
jgi:putative hydrolase of HD superfamily